VANPKNKKHKEYTRFAAHCLEMVTTINHSTGNGGRMAETGRCYSSFIETQDIIQMIQTASGGGVSLL